MYDIKNQKFGRLLALEKQPAGKIGDEAKWQCLCDCGKLVIVRSYSLRKGGTKSCGCLQVESRKTKWNLDHGMYNTRTYHTWEGMKQRCMNPNSTRYPTYGAIGISVCPEWIEFKNFYADMGLRPQGKTLDRINPFGNYEKSNCRWATPLEQQHNQRRHHSGTEEVCHAPSAA